jgi:hypothetical protein
LPMRIAKAFAACVASLICVRLMFAIYRATGRHRWAAGGL